jgi:rSAM/selenodomain-associated transferase 1
MPQSGERSHTRAQCGLAVFAKAPVPGTVKTRLVPPLTPSQAAQLHAAFVRDTLDRVAPLGASCYLACAPSSRHPFLAACARRFKARPIAQGTGDLGARMKRVAKTLLARHRKVLLIGTDSPTVPLEFVTEAVDRLDVAEFVFGPSADGGYYLVGLRRVVPVLFENIAWSGPHVLADTLARLDPSRVALLPPWYDIDRPDDLARLRKDLAATPGCPQTKAWFRRQDKRAMSRGAVARSLSD